MATRVLSRLQRMNAQLLIRASLRPEPISGFTSFSRRASNSSKLLPSQMYLLRPYHRDTNAQRFGFSSSASPQATEKGTNQSGGNENTSKNVPEPSQETSEAGVDSGSTETNGDSAAPEQSSSSDTEPELSAEVLVKLVAERDNLLKAKQLEIEKLQDKVLRTYADMENVLERTKREVENSKKYGIQNFAKSLLDVADNLGRASNAVKDNFSKIDQSSDSLGVSLLKSLLEGVEMTEKQLAEVFKKFVIEKYDPLNEKFDPNRHNAVFEIPDSSKPPGTVAAVLKTLKLLHVTNAKIRAIKLVDAKFFHMIIGQSRGITVLGVKITAPGDSPNTDGIHIGDSSEIRITRSSIATGDDCISMGPGSTNITINKVVCGPGHGISVGSLGKYRTDRGVDGIRVMNCTLAGTTNGVRIKTWRDSPPISATNMLFYDILMKEVGNPIIIDQEYCPNSCDEDKPASRVRINNVRFQNIRGTSATDVAINLVCSSSVPCDYITLENVDLRPLPPSPGLAPTVPLTTCTHIGLHSKSVGYVFPPPCF